MYWYSLNLTFVYSLNSDIYVLFEIFTAVYSLNSGIYVLFERWHLCTL
jgi:hypothetical protein